MAKNEFFLELMAKDLGKSLEGLSEELEASLRAQVAEIAHGAYATITAMAQHGLDSSRPDFLRGLTFEQLDPETYLISLQGEWANKLESGFPGFDMRAKMLASNKTVEVGPRAGLPWVQDGRNGKYAHVPFEHQPNSKAPKARDMADAIKQLSARNIQGEMQRITQIFRDGAGNPIDSGSGRNTRPVARVDDVSALDTDRFGQAMGRLKGLSKFQKVYRNEKTGKDTVQSIYMTWRTVSENGSGWQHPGFQGLHAFDQTGKWVEEQMKKIIEEFLG